MINVCLINKMELVDEVVGNLSTGIKKLQMIIETKRINKTSCLGITIDLYRIVSSRHFS